jgi:hypothetical protein
MNGAQRFEAFQGIPFPSDYNRSHEAGDFTGFVRVLGASSGYGEPFRFEPTIAAAAYWGIRDRAYRLRVDRPEPTRTAVVEA